MNDEFLTQLTTYKWKINGTDGSSGTVEFQYDPDKVPPDAFGGRGTFIMDGTNTPICWTAKSYNLMFQELNKDPSIDTLTTFYFTKDGDGLIGMSSNFKINFTMMEYKMVFEGN